MNTKPKGSKAAIVAYITIVGAIVAMSMNSQNQHDYARFHIRQAFGIHLLFHACAIFISNYFHPLAFTGLWFMYLLMWGYGFWAAINGRKSLTPIVGSYFQKWFTFIS
jgi:hypothetical protein